MDCLVSQYDANLHYADALVALFVDGLKARGQLERTVVIVTSDHGEAFGEHSRWQHNTTLHNEMIRVPLIVMLPRTLGLPPRRVAKTVALVDLAPTLEDLFALGGKLQTQDEGVSLRGVLESDSVTPAKRMVFAQRLYQVAAVSGDLKLILSSRVSDGRPAICAATCS